MADVSEQNAVPWLFQLMIYTPGTFFCYPWKPIVNAIYGSTYEVSYKHFRAGHYGNLNLFGHFICLLMQIAGNIAILTVLENKLDGYVPGIQCLAVGTMLMWAVLLSFTPAPMQVKFSAGLLLFLACILRHSIVENWQTLVLLQGLMDGGTAWVAGRVYFDKELSPPAIVGVVLVRSLVYAILASPPVFGVASAFAWQINLAFVVMLAICSQIKIPTKDGKEYLTDSVGAVSGWFVALLVNDPLVFFLCGSFVAGFGQGVAHELSGEAGTLPQLTKVADELGHTVYFPVLTLHSCHQNLVRKS